MSESCARTNLLGLDKAGLIAFFETLGEKPFRAQQMLRWIHQRQVLDFDLMSDLSLALRTQLKAIATLALPEIASQHVAKDGTRKWLFQVPGKSAIETVFIPEKERGTLCISSQVGCALDCSFCATGKQGFNRNLTRHEIIAQLWVARKTLKDSGLYPEGHEPITNVVMMGMGEPLLNYDEVLPALNLMKEDQAYHLSKRRVTVSTSGVVPMMYKLTEECDVALAVSLHAPTDELRNVLVPINKKYPLSVLMEACWHYIKTGTRQKKSVTIEYVMLKDVNDSEAHAKALVKLLKDLPCKVNLIPFNPFQFTQYERSTDAAIEQFCEIVYHAGLVVTVRRTRGDDIDAACGQLAGQVNDRTRRSARYLKQQQAVSDGL